MSLRYNILGLLSIRPASGYDLKRAFDSSVRHFWSADQAAIYRTLGELEREGLVEYERVAQETRPDRKVFRVTPTGLEALDDWISQPAIPLARREPLLAKLFFAHRMIDPQMRELLATELASVTAELGALSGYITTIAARAESADPAQQRALLGPTVTLENGLRLGLAYRDWLSDLIRDIDAGALSVDKRLAALRAHMETQ